MKTLLVTILLFVVFVPSHAQLVKKKTNKVGKYKEKYYINRETKVPHGYYTKTHKITGIKSVSGEFVNGMRFGKWTFKDAQNGKTQIEYDYTKNKLEYIDNDIYPDSFIVKTNNSYKYTKVDRPVVFIGYKNEELDILHSDLHIPSIIKGQGKRGQCTLAFFVDKKGNISGSKVISSFSPVFENKVNTLVSSFSDRLLPAIKDGKQVESVFYVQVHVNYKNDVQTKTHLDKPYLNEVFLSYRNTKNSSNAVVTNFFSMPGKLNLENPNKLEVLK